MKISQRPNQKLILLLAGATVTAGTGAGTRPKKLRRGLSAAGRRAATKLTQKDNLINYFPHTPKLVNRETRECNPN